MILRVYWRFIKDELVLLRVYTGADGAAVNDVKHAGDLVIPGSQFYDLTQGAFTPEFYDARNMGGAPDDNQPKN